MKIERAVLAFIKRMERKKTKQAHLRRRKHGLKQLLRPHGFSGRHMHKIDAEELNNYASELTKENGGLYKDASLAGIVESWQALWNWSHTQYEKRGKKKKKRRWCKKIKLKKYDFHTNEDLTIPEEDFFAVLRSLERFAFHRDGHPRDIRDALTVALCLESGSRIGEIWNIERAEMHQAVRTRTALDAMTPSNQKVRVGVYALSSTGKTDGTPIVFHDLSARLFNLLVESLPPRKMLAKSPFVFISLRTGKKIGVRSLSAAFERICAFAGVPRFYSHRARHTLISDMDDLGINMSSIQTMTGHKTTRVITEHYLHRRVKKAKAAAAKLQATRLLAKNDDIDDLANDLFKSI